MGRTRERQPSESAPRPTIDADDAFEAMMLSEDYRAFLDMTLGEVDIVPPSDDLGDGDGEEFMDAERFCEIERIDASRQYRWMTEFAATLDDAPDIAELLSTALAGRGAFRRFRDVLDQHPDLLARWSSWQAERLLEQANAWLRRAGIRNPLSTPRALVTSIPEIASPPPEPEIGLAHVLLLGAPDGKTELIDGRVHRLIVAPDAKRADQLFRRLVREACMLRDRAYRRSLVDGHDHVCIDDFAFTRRGLTIEAHVSIPFAVWKAFGWKKR